LAIIIITFTPAITDTLNFDLGKTGILSAVPYLAMGILLAVSGYLADWLQVKGIWTTTQVRRNFIVAMTENRTVLDGDGNVSYVQDFPWDSKQKGLILSSFFYGYILTQFLGGYIGTKIGGNIVSYIA